MKIGQIIRQIRDNKKISRRKLSIDLEMDVETIKRIENGVIQSPRFLTLVRILDYFGYKLSVTVKLDNFIESIDDEQPAEIDQPWVVYAHYSTCTAPTIHDD